MGRKDGEKDMISFSFLGNLFHFGSQEMMTCSDQNQDLSEQLVEETFMKTISIISTTLKK